MERTLRHGTLEDEGFASVHVIRTRAQLDELSVAWTERGPADAEAEAEAEAGPAPG
jgi:hypothetical protein